MKKEFLIISIILPMFPLSATNLPNELKEQEDYPPSAVVERYKSKLNHFEKILSDNKEEKAEGENASGHVSRKENQNLIRFYLIINQEDWEKTVLVFDNLEYAEKIDDLIKISPIKFYYKAKSSWFKEEYHHFFLTHFERYDPDAVRIIRIQFDLDIDSVEKVRKKSPQRHEDTFVEEESFTKAKILLKGIFGKNVNLKSESEKITKWGNAFPLVYKNLEQKKESLITYFKTLDFEEISTPITQRKSQELIHIEKELVLLKNHKILIDRLFFKAPDTEIREKLGINTVRVDK